MLGKGNEGGFYKSRKLAELFNFVINEVLWYYFVVRRTKHEQSRMVREC